MKLSPPLPYVSCNYRERSIYDAIVISDDRIKESADVYAWVCDHCKYTSRIALGNS